MHMTPRRRVDYRLPGFTTFYWLGVETARHLDPWFAWSDVAKAVGLSRQNTFTAAMVALGKIAYQAS
jgi:hypothetical protein